MLRRLPQLNPPNRFERLEIEYEPGEHPELGLTPYVDHSRSILSKNDSPDLSFRYSLNAYRGCAHGCAYCYARPSHELLGFGSGVDFERRIVYKPRAAELLREAFEKRTWQGELIVISANTDAYQPLEKRLELTRQCLLVCAEYQNPVHLITRSALIERDLDLLARLRDEAWVSVSVSVTFWDEATARAIEPYAPPPRRRIEIIRRLSEMGVPVAVHVAPVIPGLSDRDMIPILTAARDAGALSAMMMPVRLPGSVAQVFTERLAEAFPLRAEKIQRRVREMRDGKLNEPAFYDRFRGKGRYASALEAVFHATCNRLGFPGFPERRLGTFTRPTDRDGQLRLFS